MKAAVERADYWLPRVAAWLALAEQAGDRMWPVFREEVGVLLEGGTFEQRQALLLLALHSLTRQTRRCPDGPCDSCRVARHFLALERLALHLNPKAVEVFGQTLRTALEKQGRMV